MIYLVANVSAFFGHHAVDVESEAMLTEIGSEMLARFLDAYGWIEFDVLQTGECSSCKCVSVLGRVIQGRSGRQEPTKEDTILGEESVSSPKVDATADDVL